MLKQRGRIDVLHHRNKTGLNNVRKKRTALFLFKSGLWWWCYSGWFLKPTVCIAYHMKLNKNIHSTNQTVGSAATLRHPVAPSSANANLVFCAIPFVLHRSTGPYLNCVYKSIQNGFYAFENHTSLTRITRWWAGGQTIFNLDQHNRQCV